MKYFYIVMYIVWLITGICMFLFTNEDIRLVIALVASEVCKIKAMIIELMEVNYEKI